MTDSKRRARQPELASLTSEIVPAYVSHNAVPDGELPALIHTVYQSLAGLGQSGGAGTGQAPAVPINRSVTPDYIVCLEDGKRLKILKRYLRTHYDLTPDEYRRKWGLPATYPIVAPNYAARRSAFAKKIGLGRGGGRRRHNRKH